MRPVDDAISRPLLVPAVRPRALPTAPGYPSAGLVGVCVPLTGRAGVHPQNSEQRIPIHHPPSFCGTVLSRDLPLGNCNWRHPNTPSSWHSRIEPVGRELLLHLVHHLLTHYGRDPHITALINSTRVHILPALNPDGFRIATPGDCDGEQGRENLNVVDLNRNFPDFFTNNFVPREPETQAMMRWFRSETFVLSATFHGGALVAVYPYSNEQPGISPDDAGVGKETDCPDEDVFKHLAKTYSFTHPKMHKGNICGEIFPQGIVKGAEWYPIVGGLQDYNYIAGQCYELTIELSCCKYPNAFKLPDLWNENKEALIKLIGQIHGGRLKQRLSGLW
ncbi:carboxypeptidase M-like isoform X4 [Ambystoma mexicanum]|uniref:carboxypeptidase M-like isoform X4 n=1 Tax=Ambystoma mexicanum TaxID=8296 RepID=UPI0037E81086